MRQAHFDNILSSVLDELKEFIESQGEEQHQAYIAKCMERIRRVHGSLDGTQFIPDGRYECDDTPHPGAKPEGESVTDSSTDHDITHAYPGCHHGCRLEVHRVPLQSGCWHLMLS